MQIPWTLLIVLAGGAWFIRVCVYRYTHAEEYYEEYMAGLSRVKPNMLNSYIKRHPPTVWTWRLPALVGGIMVSAMYVRLLLVVFKEVTS